MSLPVHPPRGRRRWTIGERPPFVEAYPRFSIGDCHRETRHGRDHLLWRDRDLKVAGVAAVHWPSSGEVAISYMVEDWTYMEAATGDVALPVTWKGSSSDNKRPFATCPQCGRHVDVLAFVESWCCRRCHGLAYRSALIAEELRWSEEYHRLADEIATDEARGCATGKAHGKRVERRDLLLSKLGGRPVTANAQSLAVVVPEWVLPVRSDPA